MGVLNNDSNVNVKVVKEICRIQMTKAMKEADDHANAGIKHNTF